MNIDVMLKPIEYFDYHGDGYMAIIAFSSMHATKVLLLTKVDFNDSVDYFNDQLLGTFEVEGGEDWWSEVVKGKDTWYSKATVYKTSNWIGGLFDSEVSDVLARISKRIFAELSNWDSKRFGEFTLDKLFERESFVALRAFVSYIQTLNSRRPIRHKKEFIAMFLERGILLDIDYTDLDIHNRSLTHPLLVGERITYWGKARLINDTEKSEDKWTIEYSIVVSVFGYGIQDNDWFDTNKEENHYLLKFRLPVGVHADWVQVLEDNIVPHAITEYDNRNKAEI